MTKRLLLSTLAVLLTATAASARLGETLPQCVERYGPVIERRPNTNPESDPDAQIFSKNSITILIEFKNGIAWRLLYRITDMNSVEIETLLRANMPEGGGWSPVYKFNFQDYRISLDRRSLTVFTPPKDRGDTALLEIASREYAQSNRAAYLGRAAEAMNSVVDKKAGSSLKGF